VLPPQQEGSTENPKSLGEFKQFIEKFYLQKPHLERVMNLGNGAKR